MWVVLVLSPKRLDPCSCGLRLLVSQALGEIAREAETLSRLPRAAQALSWPPGASESTTGPACAPAGSEEPQGASGPLQELPPALGPTLFLLDEFAALGRLEAVERAMGLMAGYGLQLWPILQDMSQLRDLYGARDLTFIANAGVQQVLSVNDFETAKWLSQSMGRETVQYRTESRRPGDMPTTGTAITGRDLLTPDEIMQIPAHLQLLRVQGSPPAIAAKLRTCADLEFQGLFSSDAA